MSPPIYTPDGSEVSEIVLPDGSTASEVIGPDGNVVFQAGPNIPDSGDLHAQYSFDQYSSGTTSGFPDLSGNGYDLVNGSITGVSASINGVQAGEFNGSEKVHTDSFTAVSQPYTAFVVSNLQPKTDGITSLINLAGSERMELRYDNRDFVGAEWRLDSENAGAVGGGSDTSLKLHTIVFDGSNSIVRQGGSQTISGEVSGESMDRIDVGGFSNSEWQDAIGDVLVYPDRRSSSQISDVESYLGDKWGITI